MSAPNPTSPAQPKGEVEVPFDVILPLHQTAPVVFASPHSGRDYPASFVAASQLDPVALRRSEDAFVDDLYDQAPHLGAPLLRAHFPRAYADPNREPWELDPAMFEDELPDWVSTKTPRVRAGLGTVAKVVTDGAHIYAGKIPFAEAQARIESCYKPYHAALSDLLQATREKFGAYLLIDCHSMPSVGGPMDNDSGASRVDMVLGDANGTACAPEVTRLVYDVLTDMGYRVVLNTPYSGGFTTRNYGSPKSHGHTLQIEVNRALYMDEQSISRNKGFDKLSQDLRTMIEAICAIDVKILGGNSATTDTNIKVREACPEDAAAIQRIYAHYVENSAASFEEAAPSVEDIVARRQEVLDFGAPYIVAERGGEVHGFAYASRFRPRSAYRLTVEDSIYVDPAATGHGIGTRLLSELVDRCAELGFCQMVAVIGGTNNEASVTLHKRLGFMQAAVLKSVGFKFGAWVDTVIMQRALAPDANPDTDTDTDDLPAKPIFRL